MNQESKLKNVLWNLDTIVASVVLAILIILTFAGVPFRYLLGAPFMPRDPSVYAKMLGDKIEKYGTKVYLVNTGWSGGPYGVGSRMKLSYTRAMITAALNGTFDDVEYRHDETFNVDVPQSCPGVPAEIMNPRDTWADKAAYDESAKKLAKMFADNFAKKYPNMPKEIAEAGPRG